MLKRKKSLLGKSVEIFDSIIGKTLRIEGDIVISKSLRVDGIVNGNIIQADGDEATVAIAVGAQITGNINANNVIVSGFVKGNVNSTGRVELIETAHVEGNVTYGKIGVSLGAKIIGQLAQLNDLSSRDAAEFINRAANNQNQEKTARKKDLFKTSDKTL